MPTPTYLVRNQLGIYYFRIVIPKAEKEELRKKIWREKAPDLPFPSQTETDGAIGNVSHLRGDASPALVPDDQYLLSNRTKKFIEEKSGPVHGEEQFSTLPEM